MSGSSIVLGLVMCVTHWRDLALAQVNPGVWSKPPQNFGHRKPSGGTPWVGPIWTDGVLLGISVLKMKTPRFREVK